MPQYAHSSLGSLPLHVHIYLCMLYEYDWVTNMNAMPTESKPVEVASRCPLCHCDIAPGDEGWKSHLMTGMLLFCQHHPTNSTHHRCALLGMIACKDNPRKAAAAAKKAAT
jgi:hypothetical protein